MWYFPLSAWPHGGQLLSDDFEVIVASLPQRAEPQELYSLCTMEHLKLLAVTTRFTDHRSEVFSHAAVVDAGNGV